jgi:hypothetical protein
MNLEGVFNILGSIMVIALVAVLVNPKNATAKDATAGFTGLSGLINAAQNPN